MNLRCGTYQGSDIALHFNPRFNDGSHSTVVRNACINNGWGGEESHGGFPFKRGEPFTIQIVCEFNGFKVCAPALCFWTLNIEMQV